MNKFTLVVLVSLFTIAVSSIYSKNKAEDRYNEQLSINSKLDSINVSLLNNINEKDLIISELKLEREKIESKVVEMTDNINKIQQREKLLSDQLRKLMETKENEEYLNTVIPDDVLNSLRSYTGNQSTSVQGSDRK